MNISKRAALLASAVACAGVVGGAAAQTVPPPYIAADEHGVDPVTGQYTFSMVEGSIGAGANKLELTRSFSSVGWTDNWSGALSDKSGTVNIAFNNISEQFILSGGVYVSQQKRGATLTRAQNASGYWDYTFTASDGTVIVYETPMDANTVRYFIYSAGVCNNITGNNLCALPKTITRPDGFKISLTWDFNYKCTDPQGECFYIAGNYRLRSLSSNAGYGIAFSYLLDSSAIPPNGNWYKRTSAVFSNTATSPASGFTITYGYPTGATTVTDAASRTWTFSNDYKTWQSPSGVATTVNWSPSGFFVSSLSNGINTWNYSWNVSGTTATTVRTDALGHTQTTIADTSLSRPTSVTDYQGHVTSYGYDTAGRLTKVTAPEGNYTQYTYDTRGNVIQVLNHAKAGSGTTDTTTQSGFDANCTYVAKCNKPNWTQDERQNQTDYTYDNVTGNVLTVTRPAPATGGIRPQTRYAYTSLYPWTLSGSTFVQAANAMSMLTSTSTCQTLASCSGSSAPEMADDQTTTITYQAGNASTGSNLLPASITRGSRDGATTATTAYTWDGIGNLTTVDGPIPGVADTTRYIYDAVRQRVGMIGPDPDGAGPLPNRAVKTTYRADGLPSLVEAGTTNGQTDAAWSGFTSLQQQAIGYDAAGRKVQQTATAGGTTYAITQNSYDSVGRSDCTAVRMNKTLFGGTLPDACTAMAAGSDGPDRISRNGYDTVDRLTSVQSAIGTTAARTEAQTWTANGRVQTVSDGKSNVTTYAYDGLDRPLKTTFADSSYEQLGYDATSNVTSRRLRDATSIAYTYDNLNRVTTKTPPSPDLAVNYTYDNLDRPKQVARPGDGITVNLGYDALNRLISDGQPFGGMSYQYDPAGRRTRETWSDGFYVTYDYDTTGSVTALRESGSTLLASFAYDSLGRRTSLARGNGVVTTYGWDNGSRLTSLAQDLAGTAQDLTIGYSYNAANQITTRTASNDAYAWTASYNVSRAYNANNLNQLTSAGATSLGYDGRGNLTSSGSTAYAYTSENRMKSGAGAALNYDDLGRLIDYNPGVSTRMFYSGGEIAAEVANPSGAILRRYVRGPGSDEPLLWYEGSGTTDRRYLLADERGSIIAVTNGSGAATTINSYDEYGIPASGNAGRFQYTGQTWLSEIGIAYYKARMYSPTLGRFMQTDPIGYNAGLNLYNYVGSDPVNNVDPTGLVEDVVVIGKKLSNNDTAPPAFPLPGTNFSAPAANVGGGAPGAAKTPQKPKVQCVNADGTVSNNPTGSSVPGLGNIWAISGGVIAAAGVGGGVEKGTWYDRATGQHGGYVTTYYAVGTPGGGVSGAVTTSADLGTFSGWSTGGSAAGAVFGGGAARSDSGGWSYTGSAGFRTPQGTAYRSYTRITSGLPSC